MFSEIILHRMSFILVVNILLSDEDCQALQKEPLRNTCEQMYLCFPPKFRVGLNSAMIIQQCLMQGNSIFEPEVILPNNGVSQ